MENKVSMLGNVGSTDQIKVITGQDGKVSLVSFSLAVTEYRWNPATKQKEKMTDWWTVKAFGFVAPRVAQFIEQGTRLLVGGRMAQDAWEDNEGNKRRSYYVELQDFAPLSTRQSDPAPSPAATVQDDAAANDFPF